ncbi:hypothetical protein MKW92_033084 [Papaver armeniacum]|nr:hypothetical protein MKW92_033084 [Papaver armeniacum]
MELKEAQYFSKDFEWEKLREEIENDISLRYHLEPSSSSSFSFSKDSEAWQNFHSRHYSGRFFKERRYLLKEFPELLDCDENSKVLEIGCGNGSTVLPILRGKHSTIVYACDCSPEALDRAKEIIETADGVSAKHRFCPFVCDFSVNKFPNWLICITCRRTSMKQLVDCETDVKDDKDTDLGASTALKPKEAQCCVGGVNFVTLIFTLSAVPSKKMPPAIAECLAVLRPGGVLLFRDYGLYDMTMLRFPPNQRIGLREYVRSDGTRSYFFCLETVRELFVAAGFIELELDYCCINSVNRRNGKSMRRVWVHGKFQKPI